MSEYIHGKNSFRKYLFYQMTGILETVFPFKLGLKKLYLYFLQQNFDYIQSMFELI